VTDETPGLDDAVEPAAAVGSAGTDDGAAELADAADAADSADAAAPEEELDVVEEFKRELRMMPGDWYVIHSYAGYENRVKTNLESRITSLNMEDYIFQIEVPTHQVTEIKSGKKTVVNEKVLPGYILVRMDLTDESWAVVRNTPGVTGSSACPTSRPRCRCPKWPDCWPRRPLRAPSRPRRPRRGRRNTRSASRLPLWTGRSRRFPPP